MLAAERRNLILDKIYEEKKVLVSELSREFEVSDETIRRDLEKLEEEGHVIKGYGGAVINEKISSIDLPFNVRRMANPSGKELIAELVARELEEDDHIILDASTTAVFIAKAIKRFKRLTVITNSIENLIELADMSDWEIISTGGSLKANSMSLTGSRASKGFREYNVDKVFMSCKGISLDKGITDGNELSSALKNDMMSASTQVYLAVDSTKFDRVAFSKICDIQQLYAVITDIKPDEGFINYFEQHGVRMIYPQ